MHTCHNPCTASCMNMKEGHVFLSTATNQHLPQQNHQREHTTDCRGQHKLFFLQTLSTWALVPLRIFFLHIKASCCHSNLASLCSQGQVREKSVRLLKEPTEYCSKYRRKKFINPSSLFNQAHAKPKQTTEAARVFTSDLRLPRWEQRSGVCS